MGGVCPDRRALGPVAGARLQADVDAENRRNQAREAIGQRKLEDEWNRFLREMRGEAYIDIRPASGAVSGS